MALETGTYINSLVTSNPASTDGVAQADDHIRLIKSTVKSTLPNITGAITATQAELNKTDGLTATTAELNTLTGITSTVAELNKMDGVTATTAEINHVDGVTRALQTQLDTKITGVTAGAGLAGGGTSGAPTVTHADTSSQASVNNSGSTFIQDVTLDTYGHVTGVTSVVVPSPTLTLEIIAYARVSDATASTLGTTFNSGFSGMVRTSQGNYTFTFTDTRSTVDYMVFCQCASGETSRTQSVNTQGTSSFKVDTRVISSGGTSDENFNVIVYAPPS